MLPRIACALLLAGAFLSAAEPPAGTELVGLRDAYSKHYYMGEGRVRAEIYSAPVHALNGRGEWVETDGEVQLDAAADAYVYEQNVNTNYGTITSARVGTWLSGGNLYRYRAFMRFDLTSLSPGTPLDACTLKLYCYYYGTSTGEVADSNYVQRVTESWFEVNTPPDTGITWSNQPAAAGVNEAAVHASGTGWYEWPLTALAQVWVDSASVNFGARLHHLGEGTTQHRAYYASRENATPVNRPVLVVWYQLPGEVIISGLTRAPQHPYSGEAIGVSARIWAVGEAIDTTELQYSNDRVSWTSVGPDSGNPADSTWYFSIPAQSGGDSLHHRLWAHSATDGELTSPVQSVLIPYYYPIGEIQECDTLTSEVTPKLGEYLHTAGVVTGFLEPRKFYIADGPGEWNGIYIYNAQQTVSVGDSVDVIGEVTEYHGLTQLQNPTRFEVNGTGVAVETTKVGFDEASWEAFENVLVQLDSVRIVGASGAFGSNTAYQCATFDYSDTMTLYSTALSSFVGTPIPGGAFNLVCNIGDYDARQLTPRYPGDVTQIADLSAVAILAPGAAMNEGDTVTPVAVFRNNDGSVSVQNVRVSFHIGSSYQVDRTIDELLPGEEDTVAFNSWTAVAGTHPVRALVAFAADPDRGNDTLAMNLVVTDTGPAPQPGVWSEVASMPAAPSGKTVKRGGWLAMGPGGLVYATKGYKTGDFYAYDPLGDSWSTLAEVQPGVEGKMPEKGCRGASDGMNTVYMTKGNNTFGFWGYDIAANTWAPLADVPAGPTGKKVKGGTDLVYVPTGDSAGYVYMLKGYKTEFWRYDPATGAWEARSNAPIGVKEKWDKGSWLAWDGENTIYAHKAKYYSGTSHEMWKYDIPGDSWSGPLAGMPLAGIHSGRVKNKKAKDGSAGAYFDGSIYALKGGNTQMFYSYDCAMGVWLESDTVPTVGSTGKKKRVKVGADLVHWGGGTFFALKGNKTLETWRYSVLVAAPKPERGGVADNGRLQIADCRLQIGPNPASGCATLRYSLPKAGPATITVYDATGRTVQRVSTLASGHSTLPMDLREVPAGIYLVKVEADGFTGTQKLVIQH